MSRLTVGSQTNNAPTWTPDGKHIAFACGPPAGGAVCWIRADGAGETQRLIETKSKPIPFSFAPDGKRLAFWDRITNSSLDIFTLPLDITDSEHPKAGKPGNFVGTSFDEAASVFSPDGRWMAYASNESGVYEIYVRPFPGPGGRWKISAGGGYVPMWARNRRELFYETNDNRIMVTDYTVTGDTFQAGKPRLWSKVQVLGTGLAYNVDLAPDGKRLVVFPKPDFHQAGPVQVTFLLNFFDELRRKVPVTRP